MISYWKFLFLYPSLVTWAVQAEIRCPVGFGGSSDTPRVIPAAHINDGYCDCPTNGADETETEACSGIDAWPGSQQNIKPDEVFPTFQCPQQPKLKIPLSKLHDGICDCCDGVDELAGTCPDRCDEMLKAEREARKRLERAYKAGSAKRQDEILAFATFQAETKVSITKLEEDLQSMDVELQGAQSRVDRAKLQFLEERLKNVTNLVESIGMVKPVDQDWKGLLEALSDDELIWFLVHACQLAGEMEDEDSSKEKTCVPLRLAGLDAALLWESQTYNLTRIDSDDKEGRKMLADLLDHNIRQSKAIWNAQGLKKKKTKKKDKPRRRLMEEEWDSDGDDDDLDRYNDYVLDDDMFDPHRDREDHDDSENEPEAQNDKREELLKLIKEQTFSKPRVLFLERSSTLLAKIKEILDTKEDEPEDEGEEEADSKPKDSETPPFDPMALPMVRNQLEKREGLIQRGLDYAVSAKVLLDSLTAYPYKSPKDKRLDLTKLALGTLNHGELSAFHVWKVLLAVIPELAVEVASDDTCRSPWAGSCPPRSIQRTIAGKSIQVPAPAILKVADSFCQNQAAESPVCTSDDAIPSEVSDGHFGYYEVHGRSDDDVLSPLFENLTLDDDSLAHKEVRDLQTEADKLEDDKSDLENKMKDLEESIGGDEGASKFGPDGELHSMRDDCFSLEAGKYEYEICLFGEARQKDKGQGGRGTDLGRWTGEEIDEETGRRVWKWENGAKCWNGPHRSVTAYVTCGPETKALHAEEPDTCRYEVEVESHVACDETFRIREGL